MGRNRRLPLRPLDVLISIGGVVGGALGGLVLGFLVMLGVAAITDSPTVFVFVGATVFAVVLIGVTLVATASEARRRLRTSAYAGAGVLALLFALAVVVPWGATPLPLANAEDRQTVTLSTGSTVSFKTISAKEPVKDTPVVVVRGGPGVAHTEASGAAYERLKEEGFNVFLYDMVGTGGSERLSDPTDYELSRMVRDLDAFRNRLYTQKIVIIGEGYGARVAAAYAARNSEHVDRMLLTSPYPLEPGADVPRAADEAGVGAKLKIAALWARPRALTARALLAVNPRAAHRFAGDAEMDGRYDHVTAASEPQRHCSDSAADQKTPGGRGFYASEVPLGPRAPLPADDRPELKESQVETLIVKGGCDYLSWSTAQEYRDLIPDATLVYFKNAGHDVAADETRRYQTVVRGFVAGRPLSQPGYTKDGPPEGYQGPK